MSDSFLSIREKCLRTGSLYVDRNFPATMASLGEIPPGMRIEWKRPWEIVNGPKLTVRGASRFDLDQGYLGDCWFIVASSLIAFHKNLLAKCVPRDQGFGKDIYAGIFHFNFWWYGKWTEVIIDDLLPTDGNNRLIYASNREEPTEFWPALLEKAYAKLNGTYMSLDGGRVARGLVDLTGGMTETIDLKNKADIPANLFGTLLKAWKMNSLFGCSKPLPSNTRGQPVKLGNGIYMGHAYAINSLAEVRYQGENLQLCRLRNPWGRTEWNGDWSDNSPQIRSLSEESKKALGIVIQDEGEFWMPFKDLLAIFEEIEICHLQPDALTSEEATIHEKRQWNVTIYHDRWIKGVTAGGCGNPPDQDLYWKNPQFAITLKDVDETDNRNLCTVIVSLMDKSKRDNPIAVGFDIYKLKDPQRVPLDNMSAPRNALILKKRSGVYQYTYEVNRRFELPPGIYVIIPSTFYANEEADFVLRIFTEKLIESSVLGDEVGPPVTPVPNPVPKPIDPVQEIFTRCAGENGKLYAKELKTFLAEMSAAEFREPLRFSSEACRSLITLVDKTKSGQLNLEDARKVWKLVLNRKAVFEQFDRDGSRSVDIFELEQMFNALGFPISKTVLTAVARRYGGRNNKINLTDFIIVISKLTLMYEIFKDKKTEDSDYAKFTMNEFLYYTMYC